MTESATTLVPPPVGGQIYTVEQLDAMPVGTVIAPVGSASDHYTKYADGWQHVGRSRRLSPDNFSLGGHNAVLSYPEGFAAAVPPQETLRQFQYRFRDATTHAAEQHGVPRDTVTRALRNMNVPDFPVGVGMRITARADRDALPDGSVVLFGDPNNPRTFGVWAKHNGVWTHLLGGTSRLPNGRTVMVHAVAGEEPQQDWINEVGTPESVREIRQWKALAWRVSAKVRDQHSWCSTFESILAPLGVDPSCLDNEVVVNGIAVGEHINPGQCATLPVGTVLRWRHSAAPESRVIWFERVDGSTNSAGTRRVFGYRDDGVRQGGYADTMEVMFLPDENHRMPHLDLDLANSRSHVPPGTVVTIGRDQNFYMLCADGLLTEVRRDTTAVPAAGRYTWDNMGDLRVLRCTRLGATA